MAANVYITAEGNYYLSGFQQSPGDSLVPYPSSQLVAQLARNNPYNQITASPVLLPERLQQKLNTVLVGTAALTVPNAGVNDTTNNSLNSRKMHWAPAASGISNISVAFPGFGLTTGENDFPVSYTAKASIEYPLGTTPRRLYFNGVDNVTVTPGRSLYKSDPLPIAIPAGAQFAVKSYVTWVAGNFWLTTWCASQLVGEWTTRGTGVVDNSLNNTVLTTTSTNAGFAPLVYGAMQSAIPVIAIIGDSISELTGDQMDPGNGAFGWGRAMRGQVPFMILGKAGDSWTNWNLRNEGRCKVMQDAVTDVILQFGSNDIFGGVTAVSLRASLQAAANLFLGMGKRVWAYTIPPRTTSTDGWITYTNQTLVSAPNEIQRQLYNSDLLSNYDTYGIAGVFDVAAVVDPLQIGKWSADAGAISVTGPGRGIATLTNGVISSVATAVYNGNSSQGIGYPINSSFPCGVFPYPNTTGQGGVVNGISNGTGLLNSFSVLSGGVGYSYPPMIQPLGAWTTDGIHPNTRGWAECIIRTGLSPESFYTAN